MQPPPPPSSQVSCQWCSSSMNSDALRCPGCGKLRKDIYNEKIICYITCIIGGLLIGIAVALWKSNKPNFYDYYNTPPSNSTNYILLAIGIISALVGIFYYVRISQKLNNWTWR